MICVWSSFSLTSLPLAVISWDQRSSNHPLMCLVPLIQVTGRQLSPVGDVRELCSSRIVGDVQREASSLTVFPYLWGALLSLAALPHVLYGQGHKTPPSLNPGGNLTVSCFPLCLSWGCSLVTCQRRGQSPSKAFVSNSTDEFRPPPAAMLGEGGLRGPKLLTGKSTFPVEQSPPHHGFPWSLRNPELALFVMKHFYHVIQLLY